jgi:hypothetical protein
MPNAAIQAILSKDIGYADVDGPVLEKLLSTYRHLTDTAAISAAEMTATGAEY